MKEIAHKSNVPKPGDPARRVRKPYIHQPGKRPAKDDLYPVDGLLHRYDGRCHADCENVQ